MSKFEEINLNVIADTIDTRLDEFSEALKVTRARNNLRAEARKPDSELIRTLREFGAFYNDVYLKGVDFLALPAPSAEQIKAEFARLEGGGAPITPPIPPRAER